MALDVGMTQSSKVFTYLPYLVPLILFGLASDEIPYVNRLSYGYDC